MSTRSGPLVTRIVTVGQVENPMEKPMEKNIEETLITTPILQGT